jgi:hypothetical protein
MSTSNVTSKLRSSRLKSISFMMHEIYEMEL